MRKRSADTDTTEDEFETDYEPEWLASVSEVQTYVTWHSRRRIGVSGPRVLTRHDRRRVYDYSRASTCPAHAAASPPRARALGALSGIPAREPRANRAEPAAAAGHERAVAERDRVDAQGGVFA